MLELHDVCQDFDGVSVLRDISLTVHEGEILCLLGASGSGKTTLLRIIAGLEPHDCGQMHLNGEPFTKRSVHERDFGLMFQDFALFPHMTVEENVRFGLRMQGISDSEQQERSQEVLELVGLMGFEGRDVTQLSGGERQRVALARSLAPRPRLLMLDEPLGSLDAALRDRLVVDLRHIIKSVGLTTIYVTHDQREAFAIADRVAIMHEGYIAQVDTPETLYRYPQSRYVAEFLGFKNIIPAEPGKNGQLVTPLGAFSAAREANAVLLHPDGLYLDADGMITAVVTDRVFQGSNYRLTVTHDTGHVLVLSVPSWQGPPPEPDTHVTLGMREDAVIPLIG